MPSNDEIRNYTKNFTLLYVEDEKDIRENMLTFLNRFFKQVITACNGQEGLERFIDNPTDMIMTDIQMPTMNGLQMIQKIKEIAPEVLVIITTAFSDKDYFMQSIELKVDKYLLKPIESTQTKQAIYSVCKMLSDRLKAEELEKRELQEKINKSISSIATEIMEGYQMPCIVIGDNSAQYTNRAFLNLIHQKDLQGLSLDTILQTPFFDTKEGYMCKLGSYDTKNLHNNKASIISKEGRKIYRVIKKELHLPDVKESFLYLFLDITLEEYLRVKVNNYNQMLEGYIFKRLYKKAPLKPQTTSSSSKKMKIQRDINDNETFILRRDHSFKVSAQEYTQEMDPDVLYNLQEMDKLDDDFSEHIALLKEEKQIQHVRIIGKILSVYAREIDALLEFQDLCFALNKLSDLLTNVDASLIEQKGVQKLAILFEGIYSDLCDWRRYIFVEKSAIDIHYLDSTLFSICLQIELLLEDETTQLKENDEDLVFF